MSSYAYLAYLEIYSPQYAPQLSQWAANEDLCLDLGQICSEPKGCSTVISCQNFKVFSKRHLDYRRLTSYLSSDASVIVSMVTGRLAHFLAACTASEVRIWVYSLSQPLIDSISVKTSNVISWPVTELLTLLAC